MGPGAEAGTGAVSVAANRQPRSRRPQFGFPHFLIPPVVAMMAWETAARLHLMPALLFPSIETIVVTTLDTLTGWWGTSQWYSGAWFTHAGASAARVASGFAIGGSVGIAAGILAGLSDRVHRSIDPSLQFLRPVPITAWIPLAVAWFGIHERPAIFLISLGTFFPTYLNTRHGIKYVDPTLVRATRMLGYTTRWEILRTVVIWSALPNIFTGLRIGLGLAWMCVVAAEMLAVKGGLGYMLWDAYNFLRIDLIITGMLSIAVLGYLSDRLLLLIQGIVLKWEG
jgi:NitT/TauT family transport system permease protein